MANNNYGYQYDTNPRKLVPEYTKSKTRSNTSNKKPTKKKQANKSKISKEKQKKLEKKKNSKLKVSIGIKTVIILASFFFIIFREAQINEMFTQIQTLKTSVTTLQKENDQLEVNIQNSLNINNIEQSAKELLGMQKLTSKQTVYITLPKEDYVEHRTEEVIFDEESSNIFETIINNIKEFLNI